MITGRNWEWKDTGWSRMGIEDLRGVLDECIASTVGQDEQGRYAHHITYIEAEMVVMGNLVSGWAKRIQGLGWE